MTDEYIILYRNSTIFGMDKGGLLKEIGRMLDHSMTPMEILTDEQWKERLKENGE